MTGVASRFTEYIEHLSGVIDHADRHGRLASHGTGLLLPGTRKERRADGGATCAR